MGEIRLGSLFSGSGGFELAGSLSGITPVWNSEIEPFPILVTTKRFPKVKHLGDVSSISGAEIEPVDVISFGSPCQDLSIAGKRKGLNHQELGDEETTRSGLFMEAVRIIKEMKEATNGRYPSFAVWENVPGAYSSNKGEDFRIVLEELEKAASGNSVYVSKPPKGKWLNAGEIVGDNYSIAWRTLDAQYWGVPQRRRRIYLVADFRGQCAGKILFECEGLRGDTAESRTQGQGTARNAENCSEADDRAGKILTAEPGAASRLGGHCWENICPTITAAAGMSGNNQPVICLQGNAIDRADTAGCNGRGWNDKTCYTLNTIDRPAVAFALDSLASNSMKSKNPNSGCRVVDKAKTLDTSDQNPCKNQGGLCVVQPVYAIDRAAFNQGINAQYDISIQQAVLIDEEPYYIVRRLTPLECCRLQGFTDCWTAGLETENPTEEDLIFWREVFETHRKIVTGASKPKTDKQIIKWLQNPYSDSAEYKMWGNGIALPNALFVMQGIAEELKERERNDENSTGSNRLGR